MGHSSVVSTFIKKESQKAGVKGTEKRKFSFIEKLSVISFNLPSNVRGNPGAKEMGPFQGPPGGRSCCSQATCPQSCGSLLRHAGYSLKASCGRTGLLQVWAGENKSIFVL